MNGDRLIADAKPEVIALAETGYVQPVERTDIFVMGEQGSRHQTRSAYDEQGGFISDHDQLIGKKLAKVMSGGDLNHSAYVSEQHLLDLEREAFLSFVRRKENAGTHRGNAENG